MKAIFFLPSSEKMSGNVMIKQPKNNSGDAGAAIGTVMIDNERTRVTEWSFSVKGDSTGWHTHVCDYAVIPLFTGELCIFDGTREVIASLQHGVPYFREKGVSHNVTNANDFPCKFIEVEFLDQ